MAIALPFREDKIYCYYLLLCLLLLPSWLVRVSLMQVRGPGSADTDAIAGGQPDSTTYSHFGSSSDRFLYTGRQSGTWMYQDFASAGSDDKVGSETIWVCTG